MLTLEDLGWGPRFAEAFEPYRAQGLTPARVSLEHTHIYRVLSPDGERLARVAGRLRHTASGRADFPAVGDWVAVETAAHGDARIRAVLPRATQFSRRAAGNPTEPQVVAANIDIVFLVSSLDRDFNPRRIERYLVTAWDSGAAPVIVLNKADLVEDVQPFVSEVEAIAQGVPIAVVSAKPMTQPPAPSTQPPAPSTEHPALSTEHRAPSTEHRAPSTEHRAPSIEHREPSTVLLAHLRRGRTAALLGSSGVGKSSIANALIGEDVLRTREIRASDGRGRHASASRQLVLLPGGAILIDTPGMRELQLWDTCDAVAGAFADIEMLGAECRFRDCRHMTEPGCAVTAAVAAGSLAAGRLESYRKLQAEQKFQAAQQDERARLEIKRAGKIGAKALRARLKEKG